MTNNNLTPVTRVIDVTAFTRRFAALAVTGSLAALALTSATASAATLADVRANYVAASAGGTTGSFNAGTGLSDTNGAGRWNYAESNNQNPGTTGALAYLTYGNIGNGGNNGYGGDASTGDAAYRVPNVGITKIFGDGTPPAANEVTWHPGNGAPSATNHIYPALIWTAGASEGGAIEVKGYATRSNEGPGGDVGFFIYQTGSATPIYSAPNFTNSSGDQNFDLFVTVASGDSIAFVLTNGPSGSYGGDESRLSATISSVPEPVTGLAMLFGALPLIARRRKA